MADIKISQLSPVLTVQDADVFPMTANSSNMTSKAAASTIKDYMIGNTNIAGIGDGTPTGAIKNIHDNMPGGPEDLGIGYGTCNTAAATLAKEASLTGYELVKNGYASVLFTYDVPAGANLSINSKTAKSIYYHGSAITAGIINAGDVATFVYDGVNYNLVGVDNSITQIENLKTNQGTLSSLTTTAKSSLVAAINEVDGDVDAAFDSIAPTEDGVTVSRDYAIGEEFYRGGVLYKAKTAITASTAWSSLVLNTNYEATTVSSQIQALTKPPILCFGDSFATISNSWITKLANLIDNPIYHKELSGTGFVGNVGASWNNLVSAAASDTTIPNDDIRLIIFAGGTNDVGKSNVDTAMAGAITNAKTNFPNADIMVVFISFYPHKMADVAITIDTYIKTCQSMGVRFNDISTNIKITKDAVDVDKNHPTNIGETVIAGCIYNLVKGNKIIPYNSFVGVGTSPLLVSVQGDLARFESHSTFVIQWSTDSAITLNGTPHFDVTLDAESDGYVGILERNNENYIWGNTVGYFQWGGNYHLCDMAFKISENKLEIHPRCIESGSYLAVPANTNGTIEMSRLATTFPANFL